MLNVTLSDKQNKSVLSLALATVYRPPGPYTDFLKEFADFLSDLLVNVDKAVRPGSIDPMTAVVQRVKGFAYYSLSFSRHNKNIKMEHFFLYILSRYFI